MTTHHLSPSFRPPHPYPSTYPCSFDGQITLPDSWDQLLYIQQGPEPAAILCVAATQNCSEPSLVPDSCCLEPACQPSNRCYPLLLPHHAWMPPPPCPSSHPLPFPPHQLHTHLDHEERQVLQHEGHSSLLLKPDPALHAPYQPSSLALHPLHWHVTLPNG